MQGVVMVGDRLAAWYLGANGVADGTARAPSRISAATGNWNRTCKGCVPKLELNVQL